ncbi:MAG: hypothetical protein M3Y62_06960 [Candidatus Dormibacteraeota bacterium]|uniref:hypothetical protein n=1 Tax=Candidatus Dormibacter sp. TaxID=2973982 RepID=UPI000DB45EC9|nr:hypothetical protein [Candidatus Dormibacteraeota bacterium]PZR70255.1 MAG: hypothetical protein DLM66_04530 [Candidatus Dormibacteraeota bacterium]
MSEKADGWAEVYRGSALAADLILAVLEASQIPTERLGLGGNAVFGGLAFELCSILVPVAQAQAARHLIESAADPT